MSRLAGVILAGGQARRMGGGDKGLRLLGQRRIIDHVIDSLAPQTDALALSANGDPARFADLGLPVLPDTVPDHPGPLAGVLAGLDWAAEAGFSAILTAAADTPFFPADLRAALEKARAPSGLALAASIGPEGQVWRQPTFGLWPTALRADLRSALEGGLRKIILWTDRHGAGEARFPAQPFDPFFNINTPEDMIAAREILEQL